MVELTGHAGEQLAREILNLRTWERNESISFEKVEDTLPKQVCDNANVVAEVERISQVNAFVPVVLVVQSQCR